MLSNNLFNKNSQLYRFQNWTVRFEEGVDQCEKCHLWECRGYKWHDRFRRSWIFFTVVSILHTLGFDLEPCHLRRLQKIGPNGLDNHGHYKHYTHTERTWSNHYYHLDCLTPTSQHHQETTHDFWRHEAPLCPSPPWRPEWRCQASRPARRRRSTWNSVAPRSVWR